MDKAKNTSPAGELGTIARRLAVVGAVTLACLGATGTQEAHAESHEDRGIRPYVGVGLEYLMVDFDPPAGYVALNEDNYLAIDLHFGARLGDLLGVQLGVYQTETGENQGTETDFRGFYLDLLGYLPLTDTGPELIGSIGISRVTAEQDIDRARLPGGVRVMGEPGKETESVMRLGVGIQDHIDENLTVKAFYRWHDADGFEGVDHADSLHLGVNYHF